MHPSDAEIEWFWAGYLAALVELGEVTPDTPADAVEQIKQEFLSGFRDTLNPPEKENDND